MDAKNEISVELRMLSEVIAGISRETPYRVPDGYFVALPDQVMLRLGISKPLTFSVPEGYFEGFASSVLDRIKKQQSAEAGIPMTEADPVSAILSQIGKRMPYSVPEGYFEGVAPILAGLREKPLYAVPEGYFEGLAEAIVGKVKQTEQILVKAGEPKEAKVIALNTGRSRRMGSWKYAAAAIMTGVVFAFGWFGRHTGNGGTVDIANSLNKVSDQEIVNYLATQNITQEPDPMNESTAIENANDVKKELGNVSTGELKQYIDEHGDGADIATN